MLLICIFSEKSYSQEPPRFSFPRTAISLQYAGSTGFLTIGYLRATPKNKLQLGLQYGFTPAFLGGNLHSLSLKITYNPFRIDRGKRFYLEPLQVGGFISQNFGKNLETTWGSNYPKAYYWWNASLRYHPFIATSISMRTPQLRRTDHLSMYFEVNTNDLYIASYFPKRNFTALSFYDILYFGVGVKWFLK
jgi:hypothetical protein